MSVKQGKRGHESVQSWKSGSSQSRREDQSRSKGFFFGVRFISGAVVGCDDGRMDDGVEKHLKCRRSVRRLLETTEKKNYSSLGETQTAEEKPFMVEMIV